MRGEARLWPKVLLQPLADSIANRSAGLPIHRFAVIGYSAVHDGFRGNGVGSPHLTKSVAAKLFRALLAIAAGLVKIASRQRARKTKPRRNRRGCRSRSPIRSVAAVHKLPARPPRRGNQLSDVAAAVAVNTGAADKVARSAVMPSAVMPSAVPATAMPAAPGGG